MVFSIRAVCAVMTALLALLPATAWAAPTVDAPPQLRAAADRVRDTNVTALEAVIRRAGLALPVDIRVTLIPDDDARAASVPEWIVGLAFGERDIVIFADRVVSYPYDSLESVVRHEVVHLALNAAAAGGELPRWFHEGVATSVDVGWGIGAQVRLAAAMIRRPDEASLGRLFASGQESEAREAYLLSAVLIEDVRRRHGDDVPGSIARRVAAGMSFEQAFSAATGESPAAAALQAWDAYRRWTAWIPAITSASATWALILLLAFAAYAAQLRRRWRRRREWDTDDGTLL